MIPLAFLSVIPNAYVETTPVLYYSSLTVYCSCVSTFSPIVLRGLGYDPLDTLLMVSVLRLGLIIQSGFR